MSNLCDFSEIITFQVFYTERLHTKNCLDSKRRMGEEEIRQISNKIGRHWRKLSTFLNLDEDYLSQLDRDVEQPESPAFRLMTQWVKSNNKRVSVGMLAKALHEAGLESILKKLKP